MNGILRLLLIGACGSLLATPVLAQALVEYAAGAAIGTAGSVGGKAVSNGLDRVFKQLGDSTKKAASTAPATRPKKKYEEYAPAPVTAAAQGTGPTKSASPRLRAPRIEGAVLPAPEVPVELPAFLNPLPSLPSAPSVAANVEELARIVPGSSRQEVIERLGAPAFRVRIMGDGHVQEIYRYSANGADLGSVRVVDGEVAAVKIRNN